MKILIIGVGLIGGSLALALKKNNLCSEIVGYGRNSERLNQAKARGIIDRYESSITEALQGIDIVVIATPLGAIEKIFIELKGHLLNDIVVTDVGSAKQCVFDAAQTVFGEVPAWLVPSHPIAGDEQSGFEAARANLFENHRVIVTPHPLASRQGLDRVVEMWQHTGGLVEQMEGTVHDQILAASSHLPHILAYTLISTLSSLEYREDVFRFTAGGFRDFTRIASSDPVMWRDICLHNKAAVLDIIASFSGKLDSLKNAVANSEGEKIEEVFTQVKELRDRLYEK